VAVHNKRNDFFIEIAFCGIVKLNPAALLLADENHL